MKFENFVSKTALTVFFGIFAFVFLYSAYQGVKTYEIVSYFYWGFVLLSAAVFWLAGKTSLFDAKNKEWLIFLIISLLAFLPRFIFGTSLSVKYTGDSEFYLFLTNQFMTGGDLPENYLSIFSYISALPYLMSKTLMLFLSASAAILAFNIICAVTSACFTYLVAKMFVSARFAFLAALLYCLFPSQIFTAKFFLAETLYASLSLIAVWMFLKAFNKYKSRWTPIALFFGFGSTAAISNTFRPIGIILIIAACIYIIVFNRSKILLKGVCLTGIAAGYVIFSALSSLAVSNIIKQNEKCFPIYYTLYMGSNYENTGGYNIEYAKRFYELVSELGPREGLNAVKDLYLENIKELGAKYPVLMAKKVHDFLRDDQYVFWYISEIQENTEKEIDYKEVYKHFTPTGDLYYHLLIVLCAAACFWVFIKKKSKKASFLFFYIIGVILLHAVIEETSRYRLAIAPMFPILAAVGLAYFDELYNFFKFFSKNY